MKLLTTHVFIRQLFGPKNTAEALRSELRLTCNGLFQFSVCSLISIARRTPYNQENPQNIHKPFAIHPTLCIIIHLSDTLLISQLPIQWMTAAMEYFQSDDLTFDKLSHIGELNARLIRALTNGNEQVALYTINGLCEIAKALNGGRALQIIGNLLSDILEFGFKLNPRNERQAGSEMYSKDYFEYLLREENYQQGVSVLSHAWVQNVLGGKAEADSDAHALFKAALSQDYFSLTALVAKIADVKPHLEALLNLGLLNEGISLAYAVIKNQMTDDADQEALVDNLAQYMADVLSAKRIYLKDDAKDVLNLWLGKQFVINLLAISKDVITGSESLHDSTDSLDINRVDVSPFLFQYLSQRDKNILINLCYEFSKLSGKDIRDTIVINESNGLSASLIEHRVDDKLERLLDSLNRRINVLEDIINQAYAAQMNRPLIRYMLYTNIDFLLVTLVLLPIYIDQDIKCMRAYCEEVNKKDTVQIYPKGIKEGCFVIKNESSYCDLQAGEGCHLVDMNLHCHTEIEKTKTDYLLIGIFPFLGYYSLRLISIAYIWHKLTNFHNNFLNSLQVFFQEIEALQGEIQELHDLVVRNDRIEEFDMDEQSTFLIDFNALRKKCIDPIFPSNKLRTNVDESLNRARTLKVRLSQVRSTLFSTFTDSSRAELQTHPRIQELEAKYILDDSSHSESGEASDDDENRPLIT